jgi:glucosamine-6-phosphate deaminase
VLGLGGDAHLGMNEPGSPVTARTRRVGLADLVAAERVWVLVTGSSKADTVRACLEEPPAASRPASALQGHPRCTWWLDEAATSRLTAQTT